MRPAGVSLKQTSSVNPSLSHILPSDPSAPTITNFMFLHRLIFCFALSEALFVDHLNLRVKDL